MMKRTIDYMFLADNGYLQGGNKVTVNEYIDVSDYEQLGFVDNHFGAPN